MSKKTMINQTHIEGYVYEHKLELKTSDENSKNPGTEFINGTLSIATDDEMLNVVQVHFTYVTAVTSKGKKNATFDVLQAIIEGKIGSVMKHGKENAGKVRIDSAIGLNEWYDTKTQGSPLVSVKRNEGGFVHQVTELGDPKTRATFNADIVITKATRIEADEERNRPEKVIVSGYIFDFRKTIMPVDFSVTAPRAMDYFEGLEATEKNPTFTRVQGNQVSQTVVREIKEESAFGDAAVREVRNSYRDFVINWAQAEPYMWDDEETILASEFSKAMSEREIYLAEIKKRQDEYQANQGNALAGGTSETKKGQYDF